MSFDTLKIEVESLPAPARRKLMAYLVVLEDKNRAGYAEKLAQKIDDRSPERWLTPEECEQQLGLNDQPQ